MKTIYVLVEGQTEAVFVEQIIRPHFHNQGVNVAARILRTSSEHKGGIVRWDKFKHQWGNFQVSAHDLITSMIDLYALKTDFPGFNAAVRDGISGVPKAVLIEAAMEAKMNNPQYLAYIQVHEIEAFCFADSSVVEHFVSRTAARNSWQMVIDDYSNPEMINEGQHTAPSKRMEAIYKLEVRKFGKTTDGIAIYQRVGLQQIRETCPHFNQWIERMEAWAKNP